MSGPNAMVVVGDTDYWSTTNRRTDYMRYNSRLRSASAANISAPPVVSSIAGVKSVDVSALSTPLYFELSADSIGSSGRWMAGVALSSKSMTVGDNPIGTSGYVFFRDQTSGSNLYVDGVLKESPSQSLVVGSRLGVRVRASAGTCYVQFYADGVAAGSEWPITSGSYSVFFAGFDNSCAATFYCDSSELRHLPSGSQPWGAAAIVGDRGIDGTGYSPAASVLNASKTTASAPTLDSFLRVAYPAADATIRTVCATKSRVAGSVFAYCEFLIESIPGIVIVGLLKESATPSSYVGSDTNGWGYRSTGQTYYNAAITATGVTYTTGDRGGLILDESGALWFTKNGAIVGGGDPEAGTSPSYTGVTSAVLPTITVSGATVGYVRLCTHAREQLYRPSYAEAWDGADLLPEVFGVDRLAAAPTVRREVSFPQWDRQRTRGGAIGSVDLGNADGLFDLLSEYDLRDQAVIAYRQRSDGLFARAFTGMVDSVEHPSADICRVVVADSTAALDQRVASPVFALGSPELIPTFSRLGSTITKDVAQSTFTSFDVYDQALLVTTWDRADSGDVSGFTRTVNPAGLQSVRNFSLVADASGQLLTNPTLDTWGGAPSAPAGWSSNIVVAGGGTATISESPAGVAAIVTNVPPGAADAALRQAVTITAGERYLADIEITSISVSVVGSTVVVRTSAETVKTWAIGFPNATIGKNVIYFTAASNATYIEIAGTQGGDVSVTSFRLYRVAETITPSAAIDYLIEVEAGLPSSSWSYSAHFAPYSPGQIGYWSDQRPTIRAVLGEVCESVLCDYYTDADGVIRLAWLVPPDEADSSDAIWGGEIAERDLVGDLTVEDDYAPRLSTRVEYQRNYVQHSDADIAGSVSASDRQYFTSPRKENQLVLSGSGAADAKALHPFYAFAEEAPAMARLLVNDFTASNTPSNGSTIVDNRLILLHRCYSARRRFYRCAISAAVAEGLDLRPGQVVELTHARYGLSGGRNLMVVAVETQLGATTVSLTCWG